MYLSNLSNQSPRSVMEINTINTSFTINQPVDEVVDNLILSQFLLRYNVNSIDELNRNSIQNHLELRLYDIFIEEYYDEYYHVILQPPPTEPTVEHIHILPTNNICTECYICFESSAAIDKVELNCGHQMCKSCISECLKKKNTCPFCRIVITNIIHKQIDE